MVKLKKKKKKNMAITEVKVRCTIVSSQFVEQIGTFQKLNGVVRRTLMEQQNSTLGTEEQHSSHNIPLFLAL